MTALPIGVDGTTPMHGTDARGSVHRCRAPEGTFLGRITGDDFGRVCDVFLVDEDHVDIAGTAMVSRYQTRGDGPAPWLSIETLTRVFDGTLRWATEALGLVDTHRAMIVGLGEAIARFIDRRPRTAYVVTRGEYSDYGVVAIFTSRDDAQAFVARVREEADGGHNGYLNDHIEEYPLDAGVVQIRAGLTPYEVVMERDTGDVDACFSTADEPTDGVIDRVIWRAHGLPQIPALACIVWATDKAHAVKIASERRAAFLALGGAT